MKKLLPFLLLMLAVLPGCNQEDYVPEEALSNAQNSYSGNVFRVPLEDALKFGDQMLSGLSGQPTRSARRVKLVDYYVSLVKVTAILVS